MGQPGTGWRPPEEIEVIGKELPDFAVIVLHRAAVNAGHAQRFQRDTLRVEHPEHVVVGDDEQLCGRPEGGVLVGKEFGIDVPVRADDRQIGHRFIQFPRDPALRRIEAQVAVFG